MEVKTKKAYKVNPTLLQRKAVDIISESLGKGNAKIAIGKVMKQAGYSDIVAATPTNLTESKGFKQLCDSCGLTDNLILESLSNDIKMKPMDRSKELALGARIKGLLVDRVDHRVVTASLPIDDTAFDTMLEAYLSHKGKQ